MSNGGKIKKVFTFDMRLCTGCQVCELACSFIKSGILGLSSARIHVPTAFLLHLGGTRPAICRHCTSPVCVEACKIGAIYKDSETGLTKVNETLCIGCMECISACPYGGASWDPVAEKIAICDQCGVCEEWCTTGAIRFVERPGQIREQRAREIALPEIKRESERWPATTETQQAERAIVHEALDRYLATHHWKKSISGGTPHKKRATGTT